MATQVAVPNTRRMDILQYAKERGTEKNIVRLENMGLKGEITVQKEESPIWGREVELQRARAGLTMKSLHWS